MQVTKISFKRLIQYLNCKIFSYSNILTHLRRVCCPVNLMIPLWGRTPPVLSYPSLRSRNLGITILYLINLSFATFLRFLQHVSQLRTLKQKKEVMLRLFISATVPRCNFSCNLQRNSTLKRCKFLTNVWYVKNILANCDGNLYLPILHLLKGRIALQVARKIAPCERAFRLCVNSARAHESQGTRDQPRLLIGRFDSDDAKACDPIEKEPKSLLPASPGDDALLSVRKNWVIKKTGSAPIFCLQYCTHFV